MTRESMIRVVGEAGADRDGVTVAVCQLAPRIGEVGYNRDRMVAAIEAAVAHGAELIVLPELASSGYVFRDAAEAREAAEPADGPTAGRLHALAVEHNLVIVAGLPELADGTLYNSAVLVDGSGLREVYRKAHLWDREKAIFTAGSARPPVVETALGRIAMLVCYDLEFPEWVREAALAGADIVCAPTNWPAEPRPAGERPAEIVRTQASAAVNRVFMAVADRAGDERGVEWVSGSAIVGPDGYPLALTDPTVSEQVVLARCELERARDKNVSANNDVFADRRTDLYR